MFPFVRSLPFAAAAILLAQPAFAYIGPGAGLSLITAFGVLAAAVLSSLAFLILWPLRRARRRRRQERQQSLRGSATPHRTHDAAPAKDEVPEAELMQRR